MLKIFFGRKMLFQWLQPQNSSFVQLNRSIIRFRARVFVSCKHRCGSFGEHASRECLTCFRVFFFPHVFLVSPYPSLHVSLLPCSLSFMLCPLCFCCYRRYPWCFFFCLLGLLVNYSRAMLPCQFVQK